MRLHLTTVCYLAMVMTGTLGDETPGDQGSTPGQDPTPDINEDEIDWCTAMPLGVEPLTREDFLWSEPNDCIMSFEKKDKVIVDPITVEDFRHELNTKCSRTPFIRNCFAELTRNVSVPCLNQTQRDLFAIHLENHEIGLEVGCEQNGELLAVALSELIKHKLEMRKCIDLINVRHLKKDATGLEKLYEDIVAFRQCVLQLDSNHNDTNVGINAAKQLINEYLSMMKCLNPDSGEVVLCSGMVTAAL